MTMIFKHVLLKRFEESGSLIVLQDCLLKNNTAEVVIHTIAP